MEYDCPTALRTVVEDHGSKFEVKLLSKLYAFPSPSQEHSAGTKQEGNYLSRVVVMLSMMKWEGRASQGSQHP